MNSAMLRGKVHCWNVASLHRAGAAGVRGGPVIVPGVGPWSNAVAFDGRDDGLVLGGNPLLGAVAFTIEAVFKPEPGGLSEQRFVHLQDNTNEDRVLLELRATPWGWYADTFLKSGDVECVLVEPAVSHPWSQWSVLSLVCDGESCSSWVNGILQARQNLAAPIRALAPGDVVLGQRMNAVWPFRGAIAAVRWSPWARSRIELWPEPHRIE